MKLGIKLEYLELYKLRSKIADCDCPLRFLQLANEIELRVKLISRLESLVK